MIARQLAIAASVIVPGIAITAIVTNTLADEAPFADVIGPDSGTTSDGGTTLDSSTCTDLFEDVCAGSGQPGCAGYGGAGGTGGHGGGAAIALFASGATTNVTVSNGAMIAGYGGNGGPGAFGQSGSLGVTGPNGLTVLCYGSCSASCPINGGLEGGAGGVGGQGGIGGQGGGGAGGPHYFYAAVSGATVNASTSTLGASNFAGTQPGKGGDPNGIDGGEGQHP